MSNQKKMDELKQRLKTGRSKISVDTLPCIDEQKLTQDIKNKLYDIFVKLIDTMVDDKEFEDRSRNFTVHNRTSLQESDFSIFELAKSDGMPRKEQTLTKYVRNEDKLPLRSP